MDRASSPQVAAQVAEAQQNKQAVDSRRVFCIVVFTSVFFFLIV